MMTRKQAAEYYECTPDNFSTQASIHKRKHGEFPEWYVKIGNQAFIDDKYIDQIRKQVSEDKIKCQQFYFEITDRISVSELCRRLAQKTGHSTPETWMMFFGKTLFRDTPCIMPKHSEFIKGCVRHAEELLNETLQEKSA